MVFQGDIQAEYDSIDKETPTGTDRQVRDQLWLHLMTVFTNRMEGKALLL